MASVPMLFEYEAVVMRPEQRQATGMTMVEVGVFFDGLAALLLQCCPIFCGVRSSATPTMKWCSMLLSMGRQTSLSPLTCTIFCRHRYSCLSPAEGHPAQRQPQ